MTRKMTREEAIQVLKDWDGYFIGHGSDDVNETLNMAIEELKKEPCEDCISRQAVCDTTICDGISCNECSFNTCENGQSGCLLKERISKLPSVIPQPKTGHCKDCKWWKDSDGVYRRSMSAESQCPMNRKEVYEGNGYCFLFKPRESEDRE